MLRIRGLLVAVVIASGSVIGIAGVHAAAGCAPSHGGGDWPSFGGDLSNSRSQPDETAINAKTAGGLSRHWAFSIAGAGGSGNFQSTPVVADGCVYAGTSTGQVFAINAQNGQLVWKTKPGEGGVLGGIFAVSIKYGRVYALAGGGQPLAEALDQQTGRLVWSTKLRDKSAAGINASAVVADGIVFAAVFGGDGDPTSHPPFFILDAFTGKLLKKTYIIAKDRWKKGYAGSGIWSTAVVDGDGYAYAGTSNPYSKQHEDPHSNAIVKIDIDRHRPTFGRIVDSYKGNVDQYYKGLDKQPACQYLGDLQTAGYSVFCVQLDIDFGASPNLFTDGKGNALVGDLQKSGVYHVAFAGSMKPDWSTVVGRPPSAGGDAGTAAVDDHAVYVVGNPGVMTALDQTTGSVLWTAPMPDGAHYETVTIAGGVVYATDNKDVLNVFDAKTGTQIAARSMSMDTGDACTDLSGGISVAEHSVFVTCDEGVQGGGWIIAYGL